MTEQVLAVEEVGKPVAVIQSPDNLIALAIEKGTDPEQLERLFSLKERYDANIAKTAFFEALSQFQSEVPVITKEKQGSNHFKYAPLGAIVSQIQSILTACGLTYRFEQSHDSGISVTCVVTHVLGHSEKTSMEALADGSGSKNEVQAIGSTVSYLQRYTLIGALGITTADADTDGVINNSCISGRQYKELSGLFEQMESADQGKLMGFLKCELEEVTVNNFEKVKAMMERKIGTG